MKQKPLFFFAFWFLLLLEACAPSMQALIPVQEKTSRELLDLFSRREKELQAAKGMVSLSIRPSHAASHALSGVLAFEKEDHFRFQGFDPFGRSIVDLTLSGDFLKISTGGGPPGIMKLEDPSGVMMPEEIGWNPSPWGKDLFRLMSELRYGGNPVTQKDEVIIFEKSEAEILCLVIKIRGKEGIIRKKIWLDGVSFYPVREELYEDASGEARQIGTLYFDGLSKKNNPSWPDRIRVKSEKGEFEADFLEMNFSPLFPADYFKLE
ncbi:MAG: hypothetical protein HY202_03390 [Nitrospirae bacterium]|nr:hypothetical protein [Nitrospirota bacterium]